jgi:maltose alpha-D-glucosyltransferase / alpha-amylase
VVANLSRFVQAVGLDLSEFKGLTPVEMLGRSELSQIGNGLYHITLSPYGFYWLSLEDRRSSIEALPGAVTTESVFQTVAFPVRSLTNPFDPATRTALAKVLPPFLKTRH